MGGGTKRRVPVKDLVGAYTNQANLAAEREALNASLAELGQKKGLDALAQRLAALPADRRAQVLSLLDPQQPPAPARNGHRQRQEVDDDDLLAEGGLEGAREPEAAALPPEFLDEFEQVRESVKVLAARESGRIRAEQAKSTGERVDALMGDYPIFGQHAAAAKFARNHIMSQVIANPKANIDDIVKAAAVELHGLTKPPPEGELERPGARTTPLTLAGNKAPTARSLKSGDVRRRAFEHLRQSTR